MDPVQRHQEEWAGSLLREVCRTGRSGIEVDQPRRGELFRFETQVEKERLEKHSLTRLSAVPPETAWAALRARWAATNWGLPLPSSGGLLEIIGGLSPLMQERLV